MSPLSYWAHSAKTSLTGSESRVGWQPLSVHLQAVSRLARELASATRPNDGNLANLAAISGHLHDLGKYSDCFQKMLRTGQGRCQHAIHGAMLAKFGTVNTPGRAGGLIV
jgi:CRISPR-associated endonuclease/helicase Cas3